MRTDVGGITVELTRPESARFRHPLLLVHGLWTGTWIWEPLATYLAHRGWESWAPSFPDLADASGRTRALERVILALPAPPVVITHDAGLLAALPLAKSAATPAMVAVAPLVPPRAGGARGLFAWPQFWGARLVGAAVAPPRGTGARAFLGRATAARDRLRADSGSLFRAIASGRLDLPAQSEVPGLVVAGGTDAVVSERATRAVAARLGWDHCALPGGGHFALLEPQWEAVVDEVHRWIVRTLGAELLLFLDDAFEGGPL